MPVDLRARRMPNISEGKWMLGNRSSCTYFSQEGAFLLGGEVVDDARLDVVVVQANLPLRLATVETGR